MTQDLSRRVALRAAVGSALVLPVVQAGAAQASSPLPPTERGQAPVTHPRDPGAVYGPEAARTAHAEPLNAAVECATARGEQR
ncbi:hypothetical protein ACF064_06965 [Streptomyces sp. NPDC015492]|uniref:hypothetical protein n=1 Tax=unclassified Streptomyces TaxID=2593676 RepID=UPI00340B2964